MLHSVIVLSDDIALSLARLPLVPLDDAAPPPRFKHESLELETKR